MLWGEREREARGGGSVGEGKSVKRQLLYLHFNDLFNGWADKSHSIKFNRDVFHILSKVSNISLQYFIS